MSSRPKIPPSTGRARLPISMDAKRGDGSRALPSPTSPTSPISFDRSPPGYHSRHHTSYEPASRHRQYSPPTRYRPLPSPSVTGSNGGAEDRYPRYRPHDMIPSTPVDIVTHRPHTLTTESHPSFWSHHESFNHHHSLPGPEEQPNRLPPRSLSAAELPRLPNGLKKQQSGRRRTACDRCKQQKSSCVEAVWKDPLTGEKGPHPTERRCQRCVEKGVLECTITTNNDSYARPRTPLPTATAPHSRSTSASLPTIPAPLPHLTDTSETTMSIGQPPSSMSSQVTDQAIIPIGPDIDPHKTLSPKSESQNSTSVSGMIWHSLFEQDAMVRSKQRREVSPRSSEGEPKGRVYYGNSHMEPAFIHNFTQSVPRPGEEAVPSVLERKPSAADIAVLNGPARPRLPIKRPDDRAEKLLKHLPGNEKEMDRYVERFLKRYNCWADVIDETDFRAMYTTIKRQYCFGYRPDRVAADLRDLALLFIVLAFGVILDHTPCEEVAKRNAEILKAVSGDEQKRKIQAFLRDKDEAGMTLNRREELSASWASLARSSLIDAQSASMGETINSISAWVLVAWYAIHGRQVEDGWSILGQAARQAMASGFHIDGSYRTFARSEMPPKEQEQRRRLWAHMVIIDTSVSLYLGRPHAIFGGQQYTSQEPANITGEDVNNPPAVSEQLVADAADRQPWQLDLSVYEGGVRGQPLDKPTRSTFLILHLRLAYVIGRMQLQCFGLKPRKHEKDVIECEAMFEAWSQALPPHFRLKDTDYSLDDKEGYEWLTHQRKNLHSKYHIARISLHRPYLLATDSDLEEGSEPSDSFRPNPYESSQDACVLSAIADLNLRTQTGESDPLDRFKWVTVASGFNPALIMGIICFYNAQHHRYKVEELLRLLSKYLEVESKTLRKGPALEEELKALKFLHKSAKVHIKLGDKVAIDEKGISSRVRPAAESDSEREAKRSKVSAPFTTSTPLQQHAVANGPINIVHPPAQDGTIPLPTAHQSHNTMFTPSSASTSSTQTATAGHGLSMANGTHNGLLQSYLPQMPYQNIPWNLQASISDFSSGDQGQGLSFNFNGGDAVHSHLEPFRPYPVGPNPYYLAPNGNSTSMQFVPVNGSGDTMANGPTGSAAADAVIDMSGMTEHDLQAMITASLAQPAPTTALFPTPAATRHVRPIHDHVSNNFNEAASGIQPSPDIQMTDLPINDGFVDPLVTFTAGGLDMPTSAAIGLGIELGQIAPPSAAPPVSHWQSVNHPLSASARSVDAGQNGSSSSDHGQAALT